MSLTVLIKSKDCYKSEKKGFFSPVNCIEREKNVCLTYKGFQIKPVMSRFAFRNISCLLVAFHFLWPDHLRLFVIAIKIFIVICDIQYTSNQIKLKKIKVHTCMLSVYTCIYEFEKFDLGLRGQGRLVTYHRVTVITNDGIKIIRLLMLCLNVCVFFMSGNSGGPSQAHEVARREVERVSGEFWLYIRNELENLKERANNADTTRKINRILGDSIEYQK